MIGKCLLQYVLELQKDFKNNKLWSHNLSQLFFLFFKEDETWFYNFILCVPICNFQAKEI